MSSRHQCTVAFGLLFFAVALLYRLTSVLWHDARLVDVERVSTAPPVFQLDPNAAEPSELCLLPRIGPQLAERIVRERSSSASWTTPEDLLTIRGIGPHTLARIRPWLDFPSPDARPPKR